MSRSWTTMNDRSSSIEASALFDGDDYNGNQGPNGGSHDRDFGSFSDAENETAAEIETEPFIQGPSSSSSSSSVPWHRHRLRHGPQWRPRWASWRRHDSTSGRSAFHLPQPQSPRAVIFTLSFLKFVILGSGLLVMMPMFRLLEDAFCHQHYGKDLAEPIPEKECKVDEVQSRLAYLGGIAAVIASVVTLVSTFPYSILADKVGRKPALLLSWVGVMLGFGWGPAILWFSAQPNVYLMLLGSLFFLIGGGIPTTINVMFSMASDVGSGSESDRASNFLYLSFGSVAAGLIAPVLSGVLMEKFSPWVPIGVVFALGPFIFAAMLSLPETLRIWAGSEVETEAATATHDDYDNYSPRDGQPNQQRSLPTIIRHHLRSGLADLAVGFKVLRDRNILLCLMCFLATQPLWVASSSTLPQYVSKYFGWTLAQTTYLLSPLGILHLVLLAVLLPRLSARLVDKDRRRPLSTFAKDLLLTRVSYAFLAVGALVQALSGSVGVFLCGMVIGTFGSAAGTLARAVVTEFVDPSVTSRLYAMLSIVDMAGGALIGGPALAWFFTRGMERGGLMKGLPWFYLSFLCAAALGTMMLVREPRKPKPQVDVGGEGGIDGLGYQSAGEEN
ncbi:MFS general substrate transporter [Sodiomyces alkalinus F11]|uniref:MFS general substrate transporter n=1 Tax=Sodiomyces alkalinus (strain CBS 110278 / VKM F-3762 / F11) TaxID=1314773 RepID=A0A3N2PX10_SODAK|nr:MFS general substrate transporter [Sodiomyces alkalinus F11]ROT39018.1 MFS general substrate transporter [Sodiomyces alkalinus F11]